MTLSIKTIKLLCTLGVLLGLVILTFTGISIQRNAFALATQAHGYEVRWSFTLPDGIVELYHATSDHGWHGDGYRYTVYKPNGFLGSVLTHGSNTKNTEVEQAVAQIAQLVSVEDSQMIDFSQEYLWQTYEKNDNVLYVLWQSQNGTAIFVERLQ